MTNDKTKRGKRDRNTVNADKGCEIEYFAQRNKVSMEEARVLIGQFGDEFATDGRRRQGFTSMTDGARIVRMDVALHWLVKIELEQCRARWGECFELLCLERNWGEALDDRQVLRLARRLNRTGSIYGHKGAIAR